MTRDSTLYAPSAASVSQNRFGLLKVLVFCRHRRKETGDCIMRTPEQKVEEVVATMAMEGMILTDEEKENLLKIARGEVTAKEMRDRILAKYQQPKKRNAKTMEHDR